MNQGLRLFPAVVIMPLMQVAWTVLCILDGGIFFEASGRLAKFSVLVFLRSPADPALSASVQACTPLTLPPHCPPREKRCYSWRRARA